MAELTKEQERAELHRAIWAIADDLRGAVDGWDFKSYVLGAMFYRYISENFAAYINAGEIEAGNTSFDYAKMSDAEAEEARAGLIEEKGFFILPSELFCNVHARAASDENLNETLERVFTHIEDSAKGSEAEGNFAGLFDDFDVNSNKLGSTVAKRNERLAKILNGVADMNLAYKNNAIDAFGDAYEYLMTMYASSPLNFLLLDTDISLRDGGGAVLQELLDEGNIVVAVLVDFRGIKFSKTMGTDALQAQIVTDHLQLLLDGSGGNGEDKSIWGNVVVEAIAAYELIQCNGDGERSGLSGFLFDDGETIAFTVLDDVRKMQAHDVRDTQTEIGFQHECRCCPVIGSTPGKALPHGADDFPVLFSGQRNGFSVHQNGSFQRQNTNFPATKCELLVANI